jgi:hypothetical protein
MTSLVGAIAHGSASVGGARIPLAGPDPRQLRRAASALAACGVVVVEPGSPKSITAELVELLHHVHAPVVLVLSDVPEHPDARDHLLLAAVLRRASFVAVPDQASRAALLRGWSTVDPDRTFVAEAMPLAAHLSGTDGGARP